MIDWLLLYKNSAWKYLRERKLNFEDLSSLYSIFGNFLIKKSSAHQGWERMISPTCFVTLLLGHSVINFYLTYFVTNFYLSVYYYWHSTLELQALYQGWPEFFDCGPNLNSNFHWEPHYLSTYTDFIITISAEQNFF